jgi:hypothetical protein
LQPTGLGEAELSLLDMNPPQERIDQFWIRQTEEIIASAVRKIQDQVGRVRKIEDQVGRVRKQQDHEPPQ